MCLAYIKIYVLVLALVLIPATSFSNDHVDPYNNDVEVQIEQITSELPSTSPSTTPTPQAEELEMKVTSWWDSLKQFASAIIAVLVMIFSL